jgi:hypothetical protein
MSGGSHNYLCYSDIEKMLFQTPHEDIEYMKYRLIELGYPQIANDMDQFMIELTTLKNKVYEFEEKMENGLAKVWKAVEWADSNDWTVKDFHEEAGKYLSEKEKD